MYYKILMMLLLSSSLYAEKGCMDNSYYCDSTQKYDYKKYHYVDCNCPCDRYKQSFKRGLCEKCLHFRAPKPLSLRLTEARMSRIAVAAQQQSTTQRHAPSVQVFDYYRRYGLNDAS